MKKHRHKRQSNVNSTTSGGQAVVDAPSGNHHNDSSAAIAPKRLNHHLTTTAAANFIKFSQGRVTALGGQDVIAAGRQAATSMDYQHYHLTADQNAKQRARLVIKANANKRFKREPRIMSISMDEEPGEEEQGDELSFSETREEATSSRRRPLVDLSHFELLKVLGTGAYGKVFLVRKLTGHDKMKLYAMKVLRKEIVAQKTKTLDHTKTERKVLESIRNETFLVTMHYAFQTKTELFLVLDYVSGGELFTHLYQRDHFKEDDVKIYISELILALEKLHKLGIIYRDIKLENILLDPQGHIVLTDFGLCKEFDPNETVSLLKNICAYDNNNNIA